MSIVVGQEDLMTKTSWQMRAAITLVLTLSLVFSRSVNSQIVEIPFSIEREEASVPPDGEEQQDQTVDQTVEQTIEQTVEQTIEQTVEQTVEQMLEPLAASVVQIRNRDRLCCLGTIVADGLVVTKRSELSGVVTCVTADGTRIAANMIASDQLDDLALLRLIQPTSDSKKFLPAIKFNKDSDVEPGDVLFSVGSNSNPGSVGVATVAPRRIPVAQPACQDCVDLGVTVSIQPHQEFVERVKSGNEWRQIQRINGARVKRVYPRTVGERVGMLQGDLLVSINQQWVPNASILRSIGSRVRVGQTLNVVVVRNKTLKQLTMKIDHFSRRVYHDRWGGGPFSERRFGFKTTIVHDSLLEPNQCGGPLVDLDGNVVGLNIARSMRVATLAIPSERVREFVNRFSHMQLSAGN